MQTQPNKRIVSRGAYVALMGKKVSLSSLGVVLCLLGLVGVTTISFLIPTLRAYFGFLPVICIGVVIGSASGYLINVAKRMLKAAKQIDPGIPLTRANTAELSAPNSLVRASEEPVQAQQAVLLRPATEIHETPPEQLVRAVKGQE